MRAWLLILFALGAGSAVAAPYAPADDVLVGRKPVVKPLKNPAAFRNHAELAEPSVAARWAGASMNPGFYMALFSRVANPAKWIRWMSAASDSAALDTAPAPLVSAGPDAHLQWSKSESAAEVPGAGEGGFLKPVLRLPVVPAAIPPRSEAAGPLRAGWFEIPVPGATTRY